MSYWPGLIIILGCRPLSHLIASEPHLWNSDLLGVRYSSRCRIHSLAAARSLGNATPPLAAHQTHSPTQQNSQLRTLHASRRDRTKNARQPPHQQTKKMAANLNAQLEAGGGRRITGVQNLAGPRRATPAERGRFIQQRVENEAVEMS